MSEEEIVLYNGRPVNAAGRTEKEMKVYDLLDELGVQYLRADHEELDTMEKCDKVDRAFQAAVVKNLFLCNRQKTKFYLLMMPGDKKFLTKELSEQISSARLSFADATAMERFLNIKPGSVSVLGLMNDTDNRVQLLIDSDILDSEYFGCHPCVNTSSLKIRITDLMKKILPAVHHEPVIVHLQN